ncbi:MAG: DUF4091 domain-containing protein [Phycisphaeraceae bacterium]|nr:DUF4091 domain-containing protein [Phycisphaeraceae bacterium]
MALLTWLCSSMTRVFLMADAPASRRRSLNLLAARGQRLAFQAAFRFDAPELLDVEASVDAGHGLSAQVRRVHSVPMPNFNTEVPDDERDGVGLIPGYVPDALMPESKAQFMAGQNHAFWITLTVPSDLKPGRYEVAVTLSPRDGRPARLTATVEVAKVVLQPRRNFTVTHWFYPDAILDWYGLQPWDRAGWPIFEKYMRNYAEHGSDMMYVPAFTPPLDGVKRPTQLLRVRQRGSGVKANYDFNWTEVKRWIATAKVCGIHQLEWVHLFSQWGAKYALRVYEGHGETEQLLWPHDTPATSPTYRRFLGQLLPKFHRFLEAENLLNVSSFHLSDEPHGDEQLANYQAARNLLRELAPWMKVMDALSDIRFGSEGLTDMPVPSIKTALQFMEAGIPSWCYYCCGPRVRFLNRLLDTPLAKIRMNGWLFYRWPFHGFLHWGYNYWYQSQTRKLIDPFLCNDGKHWPNWAHGDTFVVYPGNAETGPIDSIRWEVFHESMQDYALLQTLGIDPRSKLMSPLRSFEDFPKTEQWIDAARRRLLK